MLVRTYTNHILQARLLISALSSELAEIILHVQIVIAGENLTQIESEFYFLSVLDRELWSSPGVWGQSPRPPEAQRGTGAAGPGGGLRGRSPLALA